MGESLIVMWKSPGFDFQYLKKKVQWKCIYKKKESQGWHRSLIPALKNYRRNRCGGPWGICSYRTTGPINSQRTSTRLALGSSSLPVVYGYLTKAHGMHDCMQGCLHARTLWPLLQPHLGNHIYTPSFRVSTILFLKGMPIAETTLNGNSPAAHKGP